MPENYNCLLGSKNNTSCDGTTCASCGFDEREDRRRRVLLKNRGLVRYEGGKWHLDVSRRGERRPC